MRALPAVNFLTCPVAPTGIEDMSQYFSLWRNGNYVLNFFLAAKKLWPDVWWQRYKKLSSLTGSIGKKGFAMETIQPVSGNNFSNGFSVGYNDFETIDYKHADSANVLYMDGHLASRVKEAPILNTEDAFWLPNP